MGCFPVSSGCGGGANPGPCRGQYLCDMEQHQQSSARGNRLVRALHGRWRGHAALLPGNRPPDFPDFFRHQCGDDRQRHHQRGNRRCRPRVLGDSPHCRDHHPHGNGGRQWDLWSGRARQPDPQRAAECQCCRDADRAHESGLRWNRQVLWRPRAKLGGVYLLLYRYGLHRVRSLQQ